MRDLEVDGEKAGLVYDAQQIPERINPRRSADTAQLWGMLPKYYLKLSELARGSVPGVVRPSSATGLGHRSMPCRS